MNCLRTRRAHDVVSRIYCSVLAHSTLSFRRIMNQPAGLRFSHLAGRCRLRAISFSYRLVGSEIVWNGFLIMGCGGTYMLFRGLTPGERCRHRNTPTANQSVDFGLPQIAGRYRP